MNIVCSPSTSAPVPVAQNRDADTPLSSLHRHFVANRSLFVEGKEKGEAVSNFLEELKIIEDALSSNDNEYASLLFSPLLSFPLPFSSFQNQPHQKRSEGRSSSERCGLRRGNPQIWCHSHEASSINKICLSEHHETNDSALQKDEQNS